MTTFEHTTIWKRTLAPQKKNDPFGREREKLRNAYLSMRANASELVKLIPENCKGLTVHDITHLDALWEMADLIAGDSFHLNPVEAFVFGASVLLHDSGMSIASYPGGLEQLKKNYGMV